MCASQVHLCYSTEMKGEPFFVFFFCCGKTVFFRDDIPLTCSQFIIIKFIIIKKIKLDISWIFGCDNSLRCTFFLILRHPCKSYSFPRLQYQHEVLGNLFSLYDSQLSSNYCRFSLCDPYAKFPPEYPSWLTVLIVLLDCPSLLRASKQSSPRLITYITLRS